MTAITSTIETITPAIAAAYLGRRNGYQRTVRSRTVRRYADDMVAGRWGLTHQGIAFDQDDQLVDGQHRLEAVVLSQQTLQMMVTRGVPSDEFTRIDIMLPKQVHDVTDFSMRYAATARAMMRGYASKFVQPSNPAVIEFIGEHREALDYSSRVFGAESSGGKNRARGCVLAPSPVRAALARAYYYIDDDVLSRFASLVRSGMYRDSVAVGDSAAIHLRNWITLNKDMRNTSWQRDVYAKTERAIGFVRDQRPVRVLKVLKFTEMFPLPEEDQ
jgi:hypothetical protein